MSKSTKTKPAKPQPTKLAQALETVLAGISPKSQLPRVGVRIDGEGVQ